MKHTPLCDLFQIQYPVIQGGMAWLSLAPLAAAVSNAGGLGLLGSSTMSPDELRKQIREVRQLTSKSFGVNVAIMTGTAEEKIDVCIDENVPIVVTAAGSPKLFTASLKAAGIINAHVVPTAKLAVKCEQAGVDAIICEGTEAGGHDGAAEITTLTLVPLVRQAVKLPVVAAGGIATGSQVAAVMALGADGVQMGTRFVATTECNAHARFKEEIAKAGEEGTLFLARQYVPQRILKSPFACRIQELERKGATRDDIQAAFGHRRGYHGAIMGDWDEGYFNCGQGAALIRSNLSVADLFVNLAKEFEQARSSLCQKK